MSAQLDKYLWLDLLYNPCSKRQMPHPSIWKLN